MGNSSIRKNIIALNDKVATSQGNTPQYLENITKNVGITNLLKNGSFESWSQGTSTAPDGWDLSSGQVVRDDTEKKFGSYSAKVGGDDTVSFSRIYQILEDWESLKGKTVTIACWVKSTLTTARIGIWDGVSNKGVTYHSVSGNWALLTATLTVDANAVIYNFSVIVEIIIQISPILTAQSS